MNASRDLSVLDRATLRAWRAGNLVGWGFVGAVIAIGMLVVTNRVVQHVAWSIGSRALLASLAMSIAAGSVAGAVIGARVYRWPGTTAAVAVAVPFVPYTVAASQLGPSDLFIQLLFLLPVLIPPAVVARIAWRRRPRALRG
jgi:hypothetical protein